MRFVIRHFAAIAAVVPLAAAPAAAHTSPSCAIATEEYGELYRLAKEFPKTAIQNITSDLYEDAFRKAVLTRLRKQDKRDKVLFAHDFETGARDALAWPWIQDDRSPLLAHMFMGKARPTPPTRPAIARLVASIWDDFVITNEAGDPVEFDLPRQRRDGTVIIKAKMEGDGQDFFNQAIAQEKIAGIEGMSIRFAVMFAAFEYRELVSSRNVHKRRAVSACESEGSGRG